MTPSPAGSTVFFVLAQLIICAAVLLLLRYYLPIRSTPAYVTVPVFLTVVLPASIILLVPIDLASSDGTETVGSRGIWLAGNVVYKSWRTVYWLTFVLTWAILPLIGEYTDSGYREPKARFIYSLRSNGRYWTIMLGSGIVGLIYIILYDGFHLVSLKALIMALAYAWALVLAISLMGHGLVALPRRLYRHASIVGRLKRLQAQAPKLHERLLEALDKQDECERQILRLQRRRNSVPTNFKSWIDELAEKNRLPENQINTDSSAGATIPAVLTERYLADLTRRLKRARHAKLRFESEWDKLLVDAVRNQAILDSRASRTLDFTSLSLQNGHTPDRLRFLSPRLRYHIHVHVMPRLSYIAWVLASFASLAVVWSECIRIIEPKLSLIGLTVVHHPASSRGQIGFGGQIIAATWLCYMCACTMYSLTEVRIWGNRALVRRNTYQESATWYALQLAKMTVPLSYNFVTFMPPVLVKKMSFYKLLGQYVDVTPLGEWFSDYFPLFILVPVLATTFGLYTKIKKVSGFGDLLEDDDDTSEALSGTSGWREGRALIERELQGASGQNLGLSRRAPLPSIDAPYTDEPLSTSSASTANNRPAPRRTEPSRSAPILDDEDGNFFETFGNRLKNTFDGVDLKFTKPNWLGGDDEAQSSRAGSDGGNGFLGLFGGRQEERRIRIP